MSSMRDLIGRLFARGYRKLNFEERDKSKQPSARFDAHLRKTGQMLASPYQYTELNEGERYVNEILRLHFPARRILDRRNQLP